MECSPDPATSKYAAPAFSSLLNRCLVILCLTVFSNPFVFAQDQVSRGVIVRELGLKKSISSLALDHDGFMWVGTLAGLALHL